MKIWKKFVLFMIAIISIVLTCSRYYIVKSNFLYSIENASRQNNSKHILEKYTLENNIVKSIQYGEEVTEEKIHEYIKSLYNYTENDSEIILISNEKYEQIYSNIGNIEGINIEEICNQNKNAYLIKELGDKKYMVFSSNWNVDNKVIYIVNMYDITSIYEEKDRQMSEILFFDIMTLIVSIIAIFIFSIFLTNPIRQLNKTTKEIAKGNFKERVNIASNDEIGELAKSFNSMAEQIENKVGELNLQVKQKNDFITGFTHELKTPMTAIMGYSDMLRLKKCDEDLTQTALNYIYSETKRLSNLSYKLMQLMSITDDEIDMQQIDVDYFIKRVAKTEENVQHIKIETDIDEGTIYGDAELLRTVIRNLIENARKSEPKDNRVLIIGERLDNGKYRIVVADTGKGIPKEHIERITEDFYMVDKSRSRSNGGSGMGLSLVKKILELHNSKLEVESTVGEGTTVYFELEQEAKNNEI